MPKTFSLDTDGSTIRRARKIFALDGTIVRNIKKMWALDTDSMTPRLVFSSILDWLIAGRSSVFTPNRKEIVDFGVDSDFVSGAGRDTISYTFSDNNLSGHASFLAFYFGINDDSGTDTNIPLASRMQYTNTAEFIDIIVDALDGATDPPIVAERRGSTEIVFFPNEELQFYSLPFISSTPYFVAVDVGQTLSAPTTTAELSSSAWSTTTEVDMFIFEYETPDGTGDALFVGRNEEEQLDPDNNGVINVQPGPTTFRISNTNHDIPNIDSEFDTEINATTARDAIRSTLENDSEFNVHFEFDTDTEVVVSGQTNKFVTRWRSKSDTDFQNFGYTIAARGAQNATPYLNVTQEGQEGMGVATIINLTMPNQMISISSDTDSDGVGFQIVDAVDTNMYPDFTYDSETSILTTPPDTNITITNPNTLTITEQ